MSSITKITLSKGGTAERTTTMAQLSIPDLYNTAETLRKGGEFANPEACADQILNCWHICHDLKRHILSQPD